MKTKELLKMAVRPFLTALSTGALGLLLMATTSQAQPIRDQYIVEVAPNVHPVDVSIGHGLAPTFVYQHAMNGFAGFVPPGQVARLANDPRVVSITPDRVVTLVQVQPAHHRDGHGGRPGNNEGDDPPEEEPGTQETPAGVERVRAREVWGTSTGSGMGVAILDTGIDLTHADLAVGAGYSAFGGSAQDDNGHGTHVGGTVAALDNEIDVVGVAPGATLYPVKVLDSAGVGTDSTILGGLNWVVANAGSIHVVNMSLGRDIVSHDVGGAVHKAIQAVRNLGISIVVAAGNDPNKEVKDMMPAGFPEVMAIASTTAKDGVEHNRWGQVLADTASYFTTDGTFDENGVGVTISAPGERQEDVNGRNISSVGILSTQLGGGTVRMSGTSMAAPHVAGAVALLYERAGGALNPDDTRLALTGGAEGFGEVPLHSPTGRYTFDGEQEGLLNVPNAIAIVELLLAE